jgi:uncharacterized membrane protein YgcG
LQRLRAEEKEERGAWLMDARVKTEQARERVGIKRILEEAGSGPRRERESWKKFECPFCHHGAGGLFTPKGGNFEKFKCFHVPCISDNEALDEPGLIAKLHGLARGEAWKTWLKMAGLFEEERLAPSVLPGSSKRKRNAPAVPEEEQPEPIRDEEVEDAKSVMRENGKVSVSLLQRSCGISYAHAARLMDELERRDLVGPHRGGEPREIYLENFANSGREKARESNPDASLSEPSETSHPTSEVELTETSQGGATATAEPAAAAQSPSIGGDRDKPPGFPADNAPNPPPPHPEMSGSADGGATPPLGGTERPNALASVSSGAGQSGSGAGSGGSGGGGGGGAGSFGGGDGYGGDERALAVLALRDFYAALILTPDDEAKLMRDRGLCRETCRLLGFRSSRKENREVIEALRGRYNDKALHRAGLLAWDDERKEYKANAQLTGWGVAGKKPKKAEGEEEEEGESDLLWGWTHPILIPYVNVAGELYHLRPHKGQRKGHNNHLYIVRRLGPQSADARTERGLAVITEGEFKAAALAQVLGREAACAAIPGISNGKNAQMREEIVAWLHMVGAKEVIIAYDNEEKGSKEYPNSYKEDPTKRYDTQVWALYLSRWLENHGFEGKVAWLPNEWRDEKGKRIGTGCWVGGCGWKKSGRSARRVNQRK